MLTKRIAAAIAVGSFCIGTSVSDYVKGFSKGIGSKIQAVNASSSLVPTGPSNVSLAPMDKKPQQKNIGEIMRFGFPSYDNLRTFDDFVLSYDRRNRTPYWVFEHLTHDKVKKSPDINRDDSKFAEDVGIHPYFRSTNEDYKRSGFDRGHLAAAGNHRWSQTALDQTFHLSNISPQVGKGFNRGAWNVLEMFIRRLTKEYKNVYVCTGPLYLPKFEDGKLYVKYEVIGKNHVAVPTHFFKVALCESPEGALDLFSFVMPNKELPEEIDVKNYLVPMDSIERAAGFLIFDKISKNSIRKINGKPK